MNESFSQGADGAIYQKQEDGSVLLIGHIGEPLDINRVADRSNRFAGFDENEKPDSKFHI